MIYNNTFLLVVTSSSDDSCESIYISQSKEKSRSKKKNLSLLILSLQKSSSTTRRWFFAATFMRFLCCYLWYQIQKIVCAINQTNVYSSYFKHSLVRENWVNRLIFINQFIDVLNFVALSMQKSSTCLSVCRE